MTDASRLRATEVADSRVDRRSALQAVGLYLTLRTVCIGFAGLVAASDGQHLFRELSRWDTIWYLRVVSDGYDSAIPTGPDGNPMPSDLAFFPLFPGLVRFLDPVLPGGPATAAIVISWLAGGIAAAGIFALGQHLRDRRTGILLAGLWAVLPHAVVQSMGYTETLFTALCAWSLHFLLRRQWLAAGTLCAFAGLTRPTAAVLVLVVGLSALIAVGRRQDGWRPWVAGLIAPTGLLGYMGWVGHRLGSADGYFRVQNNAWGMSFDTGGFTLTRTRDLLLESMPLALYGVAIVLLLALALLALLILERVPWQIWLFALATFALSFFGAGYYHAKARMLEPAFPLLLPVAIALARTQRRVVAVVLTVLTSISAAYGTYLLLASTHSP